MELAVKAHPSFVFNIRIDVRGTVGFVGAVVAVADVVGVLLFVCDVAVGFPVPEEPVVEPVLPHPTNRSASAIKANSVSHVKCIDFLYILFSRMLPDMFMTPSFCVITSLTITYRNEYSCIFERCHDAKEPLYSDVPLHPLYDKAAPSRFLITTDKILLSTHDVFFFNSYTLVKGMVQTRHEVHKLCLLR